MASRIVAAVPGAGRGGKEEGSVLGGLGRLLKDLILGATDNLLDDAN